MKTIIKNDDTSCERVKKIIILPYYSMNHHHQYLFLEK